MAHDISKYEERGISNLLALNAEDLEVINLLAESVIKALRVSMFVWNTDTLSWQRAEPGATSGDIQDLTDAITGTGAAETRLAYDANNSVEYVGTNTLLGASVDATDWTITKLTYESGQVIRVQVQTTSWVNREIGW